MYICTILLFQWRTQEKFSGVKVMAGLVGGPGGQSPGPRRICENLEKVLKKIAKMHYFGLFFQKILKTQR